jgi:hypothetical protein
MLRPLGAKRGHMEGLAASWKAVVHLSGIGSYLGGSLARYPSIKIFVSNSGH